MTLAYKIYRTAYSPDDPLSIAECMKGSPISIQGHAADTILKLLTQVQYLKQEVAAMKSPAAFSLIFEELASTGYKPLYDEHHTWCHPATDSHVRIISQDGLYNIQVQR